jgi:N-methylhydantoinase B
VLRTAFTVFVKETGDFDTVLVSRNGEVFASPLLIGVASTPGKPHRKLIEALSDWHDGDVLLTNDPYNTGGNVTQLNDVSLVKPIFCAGRLLCFASCFIHSSDVGGKVPGSVSPTSEEILQEGFRIRPLRLYDQGRLNNDVLRLFLDNCRIPTQNWGDMKALLASLTTAEARMQQLVDRYGFEAVDQGIEGVLSWAEQRARQIISTIPDGEYVFWDYLEGDAWGGAPVRIRCTMGIRGSDIFMDFAGTDPQVQGSFNLPSLNEKGHYMFVPTVTRLFLSNDPSIPFNSGLVRPIHTHAPTGSLLNPEEPAAVGVRAATMDRIMDVLIGALSQALPDHMPTAGAGQAAIVQLAMHDPRDGGRRVGVIQPVVGGSGARPTFDGIDGTDFCVGFLRNVPAETLETDMPILIDRYGLRPGSGGPGRYRGGMGIHLAVRVLSPDTVLTARGMERIQFRPWGRLGGHPGALGYATVTSIDGETRETGKIDEVLLQPNEVIAFYSPGGGGYGDPIDREPEAVEYDVFRGLVTTTEAEHDYGVVISGDRVNLEATTALRNSMRRHVRSPDAFSYGPERQAFESIWSDDLQLVLRAALQLVPARLQNVVREEAIKYLNAYSRAGGSIDAASVRDSVSRLLNCWYPGQGTRTYSAKSV